MLLKGELRVPNALKRCLLLMLTIAALCEASDYDLSAAYGDGDIEEFSFSVDGVDRRFLVYSPTQPPKRRPALLVLHGYGGTAELSRYYGLEKVADVDSFTVVYPEGPGKEWRIGKNYPHADASVRNRNDLTYFRSLLAELNLRFGHQIDMDRLYVIGQSMGGMMAVSLACDMSDAFRGFVAVVSGVTNGQRADCDPEYVRPLMLVVGSEDKLMPAVNGREKAIPGANGELLWLLTYEEGLSFWAEKSGCGQALEPVERAKRLSPTVDATYVLQLGFEDCKDRVRGLWVEGMGHRWPGSRFQEHLGELLGRDNVAELLGPPTDELKAADESWMFFSTNFESLNP